MKQQLQLLKNNLMQTKVITCVNISLETMGADSAPVLLPCIEWRTVNNQYIISIYPCAKLPHDFTRKSRSLFTERDVISFMKLGFGTQPV